MARENSKDRPIHFLVYLVAGATMGGFIDVAVFRMRTPVYGIATGMIIAVLYQAVIWYWSRRSQ